MWRIVLCIGACSSLMGFVNSARAGDQVDLRVAHFEITQGLQNGSNSIPLVLGKPTVIRVFPATPSHVVAGVDARLRAFRNGQELAGSPIPSDNGPIDAAASFDRADPDDALNFTLEADWYDNDTEFRAELLLPAGVSDPDTANNQFPPQGQPPFAADFQDRTAYSIQFVRVHYTHPSWAGLRRPSARVALQEACDFLRSIFPVNPDELTYDPFTPQEIDFGGGFFDGSLNGDALITELNTLWLATTAANRPDKLYGWTPANSFASNGLSDPFWASGQNRVAFGNDTDGRWRRTFAHEIGHNTNNFGLFHTSRRLQNDEYGFDVLRVDPFDRIVMRRYPPGDVALDLFDVMRGGEIESHAWITPPHYQNLFHHFELAGTPAPADTSNPLASPVADTATGAGAGDGNRDAAADEAAASREVLVVRGRVGRDGSGQFFPFYRVPATGDVNLNTPREGTHEIRFLSADEEVLKRIAWTPDFRTGDTTDDALDSRSFTWFVEPLEATARVELRRQGNLLDAIRVRKQGPHIGDLQQSRPENADADVFRLRWEATAPMTVEDTGPPPLVHQVYYSNDSGHSWQLVATGLRAPDSTIQLENLPGGEQCRFQIRTSDGFNVDVKTGPQFTVAKKPPRVTIVAPRGKRTYRSGAGVLLVGQGFDLEDHRLAPGKLAWKSDLQGELGSGPKLVVRNLEVGTHRITLTGEDRSGQTHVSQAIEVTITRRE